MSKHFKIETDYKSLKHMLEQRVSTSTKHVWRSKLQPFDYEIQYKQGIENRAVDALSRLPSGSAVTVTIQIPPYQLLVAIRSSW